MNSVSPFEGTYNGGDDFYAFVGFLIPEASDPGAGTADTPVDSIVYVFAEELNFSVKGGTVIDYMRTDTGVLVLVKGKVNACEVKPEPAKPTPAPTVAIPMTGVDGIAFSMTDCISLLGICLAGILLNKKK